MHIMFRSALPVGATGILTCIDLDGLVSIPAPREGSDGPVLFILEGFDPRSRTGATHDFRHVEADDVVSMRALPHGERLPFRDREGTLSGFDPRSPRVERPVDKPWFGWPDPGFDPPHGERPLLSGLPRSYMRFRSALPRGERHAAPELFCTSTLFRSALPNGERRQIR
jgi:hypothetical protein